MATPASERVLVLENRDPDATKPGELWFRTNDSEGLVPNEGVRIDIQEVGRGRLSSSVHVGLVELNLICAWSDVQNMPVRLRGTGHAIHIQPVEEPDHFILARCPMSIMADPGRPPVVLAAPGFPMVRDDLTGYPVRSHNPDDYRDHVVWAYRGIEYCVCPKKGAGDEKVS